MTDTTRPSALAYSEAFDGMLSALKTAQQHAPCPLYESAIAKAEACK